MAFCALVAPGGYILFMLTVLLAVRRPPAPQWVGEMLRGAHSMRPWSMNEVMLLGILVALIKIAELAIVEPGIGMYAIGVLVVLFAAIMVTVDPHEMWKRVAWADDPRGGGAGGRGPTAAQAGLVSCETCHLLSRPADPATPGYCPRCGAALAGRRHHSIQYTWALVIAAASATSPPTSCPCCGRPRSARPTLTPSWAG